MPYLNTEQVRRAYREESADLMHATEEQINQLCDEIGHDEPRLHWDILQDELAFLLEEARHEFAMGY